MVKRDIRDYLNDILIHIDFALSFVEDKTFEEFVSDMKTVFALTRALEIIGEAAKQVPPATRERHPEITWKDIAGMRDKIAHAYFGINLKTVWNTTHKDLPELKLAVQVLIDEIKSSEDSL